VAAWGRRLIFLRSVMRAFGVAAVGLRR
jgi:hypothetical protein